METRDGDKSKKNSPAEFGLLELEPVLVQSLIKFGIGENQIKTVLSKSNSQKGKQAVGGMLRQAANLLHPQRHATELEINLLSEFGVLSKLLERCYIYSTDIEYAQFYSKELALRVDQILAKAQLDKPGILLPSDSQLLEKASLLFAEIERNKNEYFRLF